MPNIVPTEARIADVKSCRQRVITEGTVHMNEKGIAGDREFMVVSRADMEHRTQRTRHDAYTRLAMVTTNVLNGRLELDAEGMKGIGIDIEEGSGKGEWMTAKIWGDMVDVVEYREGSAWFSEHVGEDSALVRLLGLRKLNRAYEPANPSISCVDRNQANVVSQETIDGIRAQLPDDVMFSADNLRPTFKIEGCGERGEHNIVRMLLDGKTELASTIPCIRCEMPNNDPLTGVPDKRIAKALAQYARPHKDKKDHPLKSKVIVAEQYRVASPGTVTLGKPIDVTEWRENGWERDFDPDTPLHI